MHFGQKAMQFASERTPAYNNNTSIAPEGRVTPQSSTSLGSKVKKTASNAISQRTRLKKIVLVLWGVCRRISTARGGIYHTISICAIVVPLL